VIYEPTDRYTLAMNRLFRDVAGPCLASRGSVVCIGAFDGVHRGHRAVIDRVVAQARSLDAMPIAVTFAPIPRAYFGAGVTQVTSAREKVELLIWAGIERVLLLRFDARLATMSAESFIEQIIVHRLAAKDVLVGEGFRFGHARAGDLAMLQRLGAENGFQASAVEHFFVDGERVSSSRIRTLLATSEFRHAARLLGRNFAIGGHVVHGQQLGRKLGYPTANLPLGSRVSPVGGVFAVKVHGIHADAFPGVASLGVRPTVNGKEPLLEAHLFDFDGDLYGKRIQVEFVEKLRDEEKFDSLDAMVHQIDRDADQARNILGCAKATAGAMT
jgi:riboflavin kinase/FMN adenylyltransferase